MGTALEESVVTGLALEIDVEGAADGLLVGGRLEEAHRDMAIRSK